MPNLDGDGLLTERETVSNPLLYLDQKLREDPSLVLSLEVLMEAEEDGQVNIHGLYHEIPHEHWQILGRTVLPEVEVQTIFPYGISYPGRDTPFQTDVAQKALDSVEFSRWRIWIAVVSRKANSRVLDLALMVAGIVSAALIVEGTELLPTTIDLGPFTTFINTIVFPAVATLAKPNVLLGFLGIVVTLILHKRRNTVSGDDLEEVHEQLQGDIQELRKLIKDLQQEIKD